MTQAQLDSLTTMIENLSLNPGTCISGNDLCVALSRLSINEYPQIEAIEDLIKQIDKLTIQDDGVEYTLKNKETIFVKLFCGLQANNGLFVPRFGEAH